MARVTLMTDASLCAETGAGGFGFWVVSNERGGKPGGGMFKHPTKDSYAAEFKGVVNSLASAILSGDIQDNDNVLIQLDNQGVIGCIHGGYKPREDIEEIMVAYRLLVKTHGLNVELRHVKAHTGSRTNRSVANKMCDLRAKQHMREHRKILKGSLHSSEDIQ